MSSSEIIEASLDQIKTHLKECPADQLLFVVDSEIQKNYLDTIKDIQKISDKKVLCYVSMCGEEGKSFSEYEKMVNFFLEKGVHRNSLLIAIGGGAVTDVSGFFAATVLRGISWWAVPTTLLGMVDAAVGGKTALNSTFGKNLIGAFHMPNKVFVHYEFLDTLPDFELKSGLGEVIKYGMINVELGDFLLENKGSLKEIALRCAHYKNEITSGDFREKGLRQVLNFGHTIGHAIEKIYSISHGESVFWGMYLILSLYGEKKDLERLVSLSKKVGSGFHAPPWRNKTFPVGNIMNFIKKDKKRTSLGSVNLILCTSTSGAKICPENLSTLESKLENKKDEFRTIYIEY
tara:strand:+ start:6391 stop:7431 length:1041 start_codon:yes stop_codon:yes gene_type:complete